MIDMHVSICLAKVVRSQSKQMAAIFGLCQSVAYLHVPMQADLAELSKKVSQLRSELSCVSERADTAHQQEQAVQAELADAQTTINSLKAELTTATASLHPQVCPVPVLPCTVSPTRMSGAPRVGQTIYCSVKLCTCCVL